MSAAPKTVCALLLLQLALPVNLVVTGAALVASAIVAPRRAFTDRPRTILISGGKMTKALTLARAFHAAGHRVVLVESARYRFTGHRWSRAVDRFHVVPSPTDPGYTAALVAIVRSEGVDLYVPVCSPASSYPDAIAREALSRYCEVLHGDADIVGRVDDKYAFATAASALGLPVPDTHLITHPRQVAEFDGWGGPDGSGGAGVADGAAPYILKSIPYDPVNRLDLTPLPRPTRAETAAFAMSKPISPDRPWILQNFVTGREYCTHSTVRDGDLQVHCCCASSSFQVNYEHVDKPEIENWVRQFAKALHLTGQFSFDFMESDDGRLYAIECNPRTHSAITLFADHPDLARAYLDTGVPTVTPLPSSRPTYWAYHEAWRALRHPGEAGERLRVVWRGRDAIFSWSDPLPFLLEHHLQIPSLLLRNLVAGKDWIRVDFNIGKLVEPAGD